MWRPYLYVLVSLVIIGSSLNPTLSQETSESRPQECALDDDGTSQQIESCIRTGERFVNRLIEQTRHGNGKRKRRKRHDVCQSSAKFRQCVEPFSTNCPGIKSKLHRHWRVVYDVLNCACNGTESCKKSLECFQDQFGSKLARRCDAFYKFNIKQGTNHRCHFIYENVRCKEALVESACSPEAGVFAFHVAKIAHRENIANHRCQIDRTLQYKGFRFSEKCPTNLTQVMDQCEEDFLSEKRLKFRPDNDLIAVDQRRGVREACRNFRNYEQCRESLSSCPEGTKQLYDFDSKLRIYLLKMQYICNVNLQSYTSHLRCYKEVLKNSTLSQCEHIWVDLKKMLDNVSSHDFYCSRSSRRTAELAESLNHLRECFENIFRAGCGEGGSVIGELMTKVFEDPLYLRYRYRPDCELHAAKALAVGRPTSARPTRRPPPGQPARQPASRAPPRNYTPRSHEIKSASVRPVSGVKTISVLVIVTLIQSTIWR